MSGHILEVFAKDCFFLERFLLARLPLSCLLTLLAIVHTGGGGRKGGPCTNAGKIVLLVDHF